eukprot:10054-Pelagococcus_subviridis.AAC.4
MPTRASASVAAESAAVAAEAVAAAARGAVPQMRRHVRRFTAATGENDRGGARSATTTERRRARKRCRFSRAVCRRVVASIERSTDPARFRGETRRRAPRAQRDAANPREERRRDDDAPRGSAAAASAARRRRRKVVRVVGPGGHGGDGGWLEG